MTIIIDKETDALLDSHAGAMADNYKHTLAIYDEEQKTFVKAILKKAMIKGIQIAKGQSGYDRVEFQQLKGGKIDY